MPRKKKQQAERKLSTYISSGTQSMSKDAILQSNIKKVNTISKGTPLKMLGVWDWKDLTDKDLDLRENYALDLASKVFNLDSRFLRLEKSHSEFEDVSMSEVYKVKQGKKDLGVLSMRTYGIVRYHMTIIIRGRKGGIM